MDNNHLFVITVAFRQTCNTHLHEIPALFQQHKFNQLSGPRVAEHILSKNYVNQA